MKINYIVLVAFLLACTSVFAASDSSKTVDHVGVQGNNAYFGVKEGLSLVCLNSAVYFDITTDSGKAMYAAVLAAKQSGAPLRIDYTQSGSGQICTMSLVETW